MSRVVQLSILDMHCASCVAKIEGRLQRDPLIKRAVVNFSTGVARVEIEDGMAVSRLIEMVSEVGYTAQERVSAGKMRQMEAANFLSLKVKMWISLILSIPLIVKMGLPHFDLPPWVELILAAVVQGYGGWPFYVGAFKSLRRFSSNMDVLVALGTTVAFVYSVVNLLIGRVDHLYFETSAVLITFILIGRVLENWSKANARKGLSSLLNMQSRQAVVFREGDWKHVPIEEVKLKERVLVTPHQRIPVDGRIVGGSTSVDESMVTGESVPVFKDQGTSVFSGTVNGAGRIEVEVEAEYGATFLNRIVDLVEKAQESKPPIQKKVDIVAAYFVPSVLCLALLAFCVWTFALGELTEGIINGVSVLVIACPCALGLATPMVILVATSRAAREGILVKEAAVFEMLHRMQKLVLDKTGTVTEGRLEVIETSIRKGVDQVFFVALAATLAKYSDHPAAATIFQACFGAEKEAASYQVVPGKGVEAVVDGKKFRLGSVAFIQEWNVSVTDLAKNDFHTIVVVAQEDKVLGHFALRDTIKECAYPFIRGLKGIGVEPILLSGDRLPVVKAVASELGILDYYADVKPGSKGEKVREIIKSGFCTGMVGDGVNDSVALVESDVGFALGSGTDVAMESASIGIIRKDLENVLRSIALGKAVHLKMWQNLGFAFVYNVAGILLAMFGFLNPMVAGAAMACSSISVVINAILLRYQKL